MEIKKVFNKMWTACKWLIGIILGILGGLVIGKVLREVAGIGEVREVKNWIPDGKDGIIIVDDDVRENQRIKLPIDPKTKKRVKHEDIAAVGLAKGGKLNVAIVHRNINRHSRITAKPM